MLCLTVNIFWLNQNCWVEFYFLLFLLQLLLWLWLLISLFFVAPKFIGSGKVLWLWILQPPFPTSLERCKGYQIKILKLLCNQVLQKHTASPSNLVVHNNAMGTNQPLLKEDTYSQLFWRFGLRLMLLNNSQAICTWRSKRVL